MTGISSSPSPHRYLVLSFPRLPTDRLKRLRSLRSAERREQGPQDDLPPDDLPPDDLPHAIVARQGNLLVLAAVNTAAEAAGLTTGLRLADARARLPGLLIDPHEPAEDEALLQAIADWADRYTPLVATAAPHLLILEITGAAHLQGGEEPLLADAVRRLQRQGLTSRAAIASTVGAAVALAWHRPGCILAPGQEREALAPLPLAALRLAPQTAGSLARLGLERIGDILDQPRAPLSARFGPGLLTALDRALGQLDEPVSPRRIVPPLVVERGFAEPLLRMEDVEATILSLGETLIARLAERGEGARLIELSIFHVDGLVTRATAGTSRPLENGRFLMGLLRERLARLKEKHVVALESQFGFDLIRLAVLDSQQTTQAQGDLVAPVSTTIGEARLVDRLGARLGLGAVQRAMPQNAHLPERAFLMVPAATVKEKAISFAGEAIPLPGAAQERPLRLLDPAEPVEAVANVPDGPPLRFRWRRALHEIIRAEGPERISPPWWETEDFSPEAEARTTRDYYRVEDLEGLRFWLFRQGLYERGTGVPRWFLHGLFG